MTSSSKQLRWGLIGCGKISNDFVRALHYCKNDNKVVAVATASSAERAAEFHKSLGLDCTTQVYGSYDDLLADSNVDIVYIANLNNAHCQWTLKALDAGKHVLCEKPMGINVAEVCKMVEKAKEKKLFLMEPEGRLSVGECETPVLDIGVYTVTFSLFVFRGKNPKSIHVVGHKSESGCDHWANVTLDFGDGTQALCYFNGTACTPNSAFVSFEKGQIQIPEFFWTPTRLIEFETPIVSSALPPKTHEFPLHDEKTVADFYYHNSSGLRYEADHVFECIQQGKLQSDIMTHEDSISVHKIITEIRRQLGVVFSQDST